MKNTLVPIDRAGRIVLPKNVRDELAIKPGDLLKISVQDDQVTLRLSREKAGFIRRGDALVFSTGQADLLDNAVVENIRGSESSSWSVDIPKAVSSPRKAKNGQKNL